MVSLRSWRNNSDISRITFVFGFVDFFLLWKRSNLLWDHLNKSTFTHRNQCRSCTWSSVPHSPLLPSSLFLTSLTHSSFSALPVFLSPSPKESSLASPRVHASTRPCTVGRRVLGQCSRQAYLLSSAFNRSASSPPGRFHQGLGSEQMQAGVESWSGLSCICWPALDLLTHRSGSAALRKLRSWYQRRTYLLSFQKTDLAHTSKLCKC